MASRTLRARFQNLGVVLEGVYPKWGLQNEMERYRLASHWKEVVGCPIALHSVPDKIRFHTLTLLVDSAPWKNELLFFKAEIVQKANLFFKKPLIQDVSFKIGVLPVSPKKAVSHVPLKQKEVKLPRDLAPLDDTIKTVEDKALQAVIRQALLRYFASHKP